MSNSSLVNYTKLSPNCNSPRNHQIDTLTIHMTEGQISVEALGDLFAKTSRNASCNYGIGSDGRILLCVNESDRSFCSGSKSNDSRAITIEVASDKYAPYAVKDVVFDRLIDLCVDIVKRNPGFKGSLRWKGDKLLIGDTEKQNMTLHKWFQSTNCPGEWLESRMGKIAAEVTARLKLVGYKENDIVYFKGNKEFSSATSTKSIVTKPSLARITKVVDAKHPYHCRRINSEGDFAEGGVYGWVNADDLTS